MKRLTAIALAILASIALITQGIAAGQYKTKEQMIDEGVSRYRFIILTEAEERMLAQCLEAECSSAEYCGNGNIEEGLRCKRATCQVILNRILDPRFKAEGRLDKIICSPSQFTTYPSFLGTEPSEETYQVMYEVLMGENLVVDYDVVFFSLAIVPGTQYVDTIGKHVFSK